MDVGWSGSIQEFMKMEQIQFLNALQHSIPDASDSQVRAWIDTYQKIKIAFQTTPKLNAYILFEYQLLRGGGRRPDVLLLVNNQLLVIECKSYNEVSNSEYIQTSLYVRDLEHYHSEVQEKDLDVHGLLLLTNAPGSELKFVNQFKIFISSLTGFERIIKKAETRNERPSLNVQEFLSGTYQPSPSVIEAAQTIIKREPLPRVRALDSSNFEYVYDTGEAIIQQAKSNDEHHLVLITGEPGAGKTYLGLLIAHDHPEAIYLSGNGPLVDVLQHALQNRTFVQRLYNYKMDYLRRQSAPSEHIIIFDEAQRAWDKNKVNQSLKKSNIPASNLSEPDIVMNIATEDKEWSVTIGLVGEGQEIYSGEEEGLPLWNEALINKQVTVHGKQGATLFTHATRVNTSEALHLDTSLRSHAALEYGRFVTSVIDADFKTAAEIARDLDTSRFHLRITRDLETAKSIARRLYTDDTKTIGVVCAGGADHQKEIDVLPFNERSDRPSKIAQYFNVPTSSFYCKTLNYSITEFQSQGLELDFAILQWDNDFYLEEGQWKGKYFQRNVENPLQIKRNAYRVNLTRGRDGLIIYVPKKPELTETWQMFKNVLNIPEL
ncbi:DUF2075 domain-containing protein [Exiguobacterium sp. SH0S1]|uniref:DNA/RNA helicase domain-containing protein n=1 Tax=Exiguobacterium sp. SH0S1 TaxID=2510949 RepID=UPI00103E42F2|nr:DNA/RNA helicase domain-containing protein [Exiguobacterium sp. SH0S1]TCI75906.1 DUF2075 domain-containing protein [Exiguobacterium sp. SH0S1]